MNLPFRTGFGYDVHAWEKGRKLFLGGVEIPYDYGLKGHSDADVLLHAICDAMLGALALGDIGKHFPDTDKSYKNIDSRKLLKKTAELIASFGYLVGNIDSTVVMQKPKLISFIPEMQETIAGILEISSGRVSVKATTAERLGFVGREEGAEAFATVLLIRDDSDA